MRWGYAALSLAALCSLPAFCVAASADAIDLVEVHTAAPIQDSPVLVTGSLSAQTEAKRYAHTNSLQQTEQPGVADAASLSSAYYTMRGIKPGLPATCYGQPCSASACYPAALVTVKKYVNYVNVTAVVQFSRRYTIISCSNLDGDCEIFADGAASVTNLTQLSDSSYSISVQMKEEGLARLFWTPSDCTGAVTQILLSTITYDITPPILAIVQRSSTGNSTLAQTMPPRLGRRLQYFTVRPAAPATKFYGANVVFNFSEPVQGFGANYAFVHGGTLSAAGMAASDSKTQFSATIVADNTKSALVMVTGSTYQDLAGNVGTSDLNATVPVSVLSTDTTLGSTTAGSSSSSRLSSGRLAGVIVGVILGVFLAVLLCFLCMWRRSQIREAKEEGAAAAAAAASGPVMSAPQGAEAGKAGRVASKGEMKGKGVQAELDVKPSAPTSLPLRVRFGDGGTPTSAPTPNPAFALGGIASRAGSASELVSARSELPISTLTDARTTSQDLTSRGSQAMGTLIRTDRQDSVDERSDSAMLDSRPSGPLIQDPSGIYTYGSGSYEGPIATFPSDAAGLAEAIHTASPTPRTHSRFANVSEGAALPRATTAAGSRAWGDVDLTEDE